MKLFAYIINGTPVNQINSYLLDELNGNNPYISSTQSSIDGYEDISSIENWQKFGVIISTDGLQVRSRIIENIDYLGGWDNLSNNEKDLCIKYNARSTEVLIDTDNTNKVIHLMMTRGLSQVEAMGSLLRSFSEFNRIEIESCNKRISSDKLFQVIGTYLSISDGSDFIRTTYSLAYLYRTHGIMGVNEGASGEGIYDFIQSTSGTQYEFTGLAQQGYIVNNGTINDLINSIMDILKNGNY